jgi:class 3 adenylate cyclase
LIGPRDVGFVVGLLFLGLPAVFGACTKIVDAALERIATLRAVAEAVGAGRIELRADEAGNREIVDLSRRFNDMLEALVRTRLLERIFGRRSDAALERLRAQHREGTITPQLSTATIAVIEVRDLSSVATSGSPEMFLALLGKFFERVAASVDKYEGYLLRASPDSLVAVFNAPFQHSDHMVRGTRCAIELQTELVALNRDHTRGMGKLIVAVGVASGPVVTGTTMNAQGPRYLIAGETLELATQLADLTPAGQVWVNQANAETLPMYIPSVMLAALTLRGKNQIIAPYRVWPPP